MRLQKLIFLFAVIFFTFTPLVFGAWAYFNMSVPNVDVTLGVLESSESEFSVSFDSDFTDERAVPYGMLPESHCNQFIDEEGCVDEALNLCSYIALQPVNEESTEVGFTQNPNPVWATGELQNSIDDADRWNLVIKSPCFEGECPADYNSEQNGAPLAQDLKGHTFKCDLYVSSGEIPQYVKNYLMPEVAYADDIGNVLRVSAVFTGETQGCTENCFSNILFFPGLMGSQLYEEGLDCGPDIVGSECGDQRLWVSFAGPEQEKLSLNSQGQSINNLFTKDYTQKLDTDDEETGIVDETLGLNTYKSFISDLKSWKDDEEIINDYAFIPYDWRFSLEDIITNGSVNSEGDLRYNNAQDFSESFILEKLTELQASSRTGKVTIIAHSNGGLVAKALIQKLKDTNNSLYEKIDKVILVAVPQVGTPEAILSLLHGTELGYGFVMQKDRARQLSENMSTIYNLLPSASYFTTVDPAFAVDKVISFENKPFFSPQTAQFGVHVSDEAELKDYVLGGDGRTKPSFSDTLHPNIGNSFLYDEAQDVHDILDNWEPSSETKVIQVAGWGEETIAGLDYKTYAGLNGTEKLSYTPRHVVDGDGVVVTPSALWMSDSNPNVERWWVDLLEEGNLFLNREHGDILEIQNLRDFIKTRIKNTIFVDPESVMVDNSSTLVSTDTRLHYTLHSPLTLGVTDSEGRYTGQDPVTREIREEIPGVNYKQVGEVQFISVPADLAHTLKMKGYESGDFSLDIEKQEGNEIVGQTSFQGIPSSASTLATINVAPEQQIEVSVLEIDQNGDGNVDQTLEATLDGVTMYDVTPPELKVTFDIATKDVIFSAQDLIDPSPVLTRTSTTITLMDNSDNTTIIPFKKLKELPTRLRLTYNKITRNGVTTTIPNTNIVYDWKEKNGVLTDLDTKIMIRGVEKYIFNYKKANNVTIIKEKTSAGVVTTTRPGFVVVTAKTEGDGLLVSY